ncbi:hypothetical protein C9I56_40165 [Paraburkholderia caribensis]|nr:hypothetical protein C9I56_40165 [Paraburkholderia caribensis]
MTVDMLSRRPLNVPRYASLPNRRSGSAVLFRSLNRKFFRALRCNPTNRAAFNDWSFVPDDLKDSISS